MWFPPPDDATKDPIREALLGLPLIKDLVSEVLKWYGNREGDFVSYTGTGDGKGDRVSYAGGIQFFWKNLIGGGTISRVYLYDDSCKPWDKPSHYISYLDRKAQIERCFQVVPWGPTEIDVKGVECGGQIHYQCPLCWTRYKKNGEPYARAEQAFHHHGCEGFSHSGPTSREVHCDSGVRGLVSRVNITIAEVHSSKCKCHRKFKSAGRYSLPFQ